MTIKNFWILTFVLISCKNSSTPNYYKQANTKTEINNQSFIDSARFLYKSEKYSEALKYYNFLLSRDSSNGLLYFNRGNCKLSLFDIQGALTDFRKSIAYDYNEKSKSYLNIGVIYLLELRKYDSAIYYYNESLKLDPNNEKAKQGRKAAVDLLAKQLRQSTH